MKTINPSTDISLDEHQNDDPNRIKEKLEHMQKDASALAEKERSLHDEIAKTQKALAELAEHTPKQGVEPIVGASNANLPSNTMIQHGTLPSDQNSSAPIQTNPTQHERKITIQLSDFGVPSIAYDLSKPHYRIPYSNNACIKFLSTITDGRITERITETDHDTAEKIIAQLEEERAHLRVKFAEYVEFPTHDIIGLSADELERKLYARHFRNKEAQHRVFMIGFSVAIFCVIGAVLTDTISDGNTTLATIAATVGAATTATGIAGHLTMRIGDARNEKRAVRTIQELALLDTVIEKFHAALR